MGSTAKMTQEHAEYTISMLKEMFPEESDNLNIYHGEIVTRMTTPNPPPPSAGLLSVEFAASAPKPPSPSPSKCEGAWMDAIVDFVLFIISLADIDTESVDKKEISVQFNDAEINGLTLRVVKLTEAGTAYMAKGGVSEMYELAKAFIKLLSGVYHTVFKAVWDVIKANMKWYQWVEDGLEALATILIWFASDFLVLIGKVIMAICSAVSFIESLYSAINCCSPEQFIKDLIDSGGHAHTTGGLVIQQNHNPAVVEFNNTIYVFMNSSKNKIYYKTTTSAKLANLYTQRTSFENQIKAIDQESNLTKEEISNKVAPITEKIFELTKETWSWATTIEVIGNNTASPSAVVYAGKIFLYYKGNENKDWGRIWQVTTNDGTNWGQPVMLTTAISTSTGPVAAVHKYAEYLGLKDEPLIYLFYQGSGGDDRIWYILSDDTGAITGDPSPISDSITTATIPCVMPYYWYLAVLYRSSGKSTNIWMTTTDVGLEFIDEFALTPSINTNGTPAIYNPEPGNTAVGKTMYFPGTEKTPIIYKHPILTDTSLAIFKEDPTPTKLTSVCSPAIIALPPGGASIITANYPGDFEIHSLGEI